MGANNVINESGNNVSNILPPNIYPDNFMSLVPNIINLVGEYSFIFFGILGLCAIAAIQSMASLILTSSAIVTRDVVKRFFVKNLTNRMEIFSSRILIMFIFIISLILSLLAQGNIFDLASFSLAIACQMFVPLASYMLFFMVYKTRCCVWNCNWNCSSNFYRWNWAEFIWRNNSME